MANENMHAILEARLTAALDAETRLTGMAVLMGEALIDLRNQVSAAQLALSRVYEVQPHRRSTDSEHAPMTWTPGRLAAGPLTFDAADKVAPSAWPPSSGPSKPVSFVQIRDDHAAWLESQAYSVAPITNGEQLP